MGSGTYYPEASGDDGYWRDNTDPVYHDDSLVFGAGNYGENSLVRFKSLDIPQGNVITSAIVKVTRKLYSASAMNINLYFRDVDDVTVMPTTKEECAGLSLTVAYNWVFSDL